MFTLETIAQFHSLFLVHKSCDILINPETNIYIHKRGIIGAYEYNLHTTKTHENSDI